MPFTLAHPAIVVPLVRPLTRRFGKAAIFSSLVIGSMTPDIAFLLPIGVNRHQSHSLAGLLWCCLPVGFAVYFIYHWWLKSALIDLLPRAGFSRLHDYAHTRDAIAWRLLPRIALCLLIGAATHDVWDSFTHRDSFAVRNLPWLRVHLFSGGGFWIYIYSALQWLCSFAGLGYLAWKWHGWLAATRQPVDAPHSPLSAHQQLLIAGVIATFSIAYGLAAAWPYLFGGQRISSQELVSVTLLGVVSGFGLALLAYAAVWRWVLVRS
jgi:hypothetical protein